MRARSTLAAAVVAILAWSGWPVAAHEGAGGLALEQSTAVTDNQVRYVVRLTSVNDGHGAVNATVTATLVAADGTARTPVPLTAVDEDGRYGATITFPAPGTWTVRFTAVKPPAVLEQPTTIAAPTTTTTVAPPTTTTAPADGDGAPGGLERDVEDPGGAPPDGEAGGSGGKGLLVVGLLAAGAAVAGAGGWAAKRRKG